MSPILNDFKIRYRYKASSRVDVNPSYVMIGRMDSFQFKCL